MARRAIYAQLVPSPKKTDEASIKEFRDFAEMIIWDNLGREGYSKAAGNVTLEWLGRTLPDDEGKTFEMVRCYVDDGISTHAAAIAR